VSATVVPFDRELLPLEKCRFLRARNDSTTQERSHHADEATAMGERSLQARRLGNGRDSKSSWGHHTHVSHCVADP
jgi:hypothetical protein